MTFSFEKINDDFANFKHWVGQLARRTALQNKYAREMKIEVII